MTAAENTELGANLAGVIRAIIRSELSDQENARTKTPQYHESGGSRAGRIWTSEEENALEEELHMAFAFIAKVHRRNYPGILARAKEVTKRMF